MAVFDGAHALVYVNESVPTDPIKATLEVGAGNSGVRYTAKAAGVAGNSIRVAHVNPGVAGALSVAVAGTSDVTVTLAHDGAAVTSTAAQVRDAVNAHAGASALLQADLVGDGTGVAQAQALTNLAGGADSTTPPASYVPVAEQQGVDIDDSKDEIEANAKGVRFNRTIPGRRSISFELSMLRTFGDASQALLYDTYDSEREIIIQLNIAPEATGGAPDIREARARLTSWAEGYPDSDVATVSTNVQLQEPWRKVS